MVGLLRQLSQWLSRHVILSKVNAAYLTWLRSVSRSRQFRAAEIFLRRQFSFRRTHTFWLVFVGPDGGQMTFWVGHVTLFTSVRSVSGCTVIDCELWFPIPSVFHR